MSKHRMLVIGAISLLTLGLAGCQTDRLMRANYRAVDRLLAKKQVCLPRNSPILCLTLVDVDNLETASTLGRVAAQHCAARMSQHGYKVISMNVRRDRAMGGSRVASPHYREPLSIVINTGGEFALSRDSKDLGSIHPADYLLVGTYARARGEVDPNDSLRTRDSLYVSLKLIRATDNSIVAASDYVIPCDYHIAYLVSGSRTFAGR